MAKTIGKLVTVLTANAAPMRRELRRTENNLDRFSRRVGRVANSFAAAATLGAAAAAASASFVMRTARENDELAKFAQRIGLNAKSLARLQFAGQRTGVEVNTMNMALQRLDRRLGEVAATGKGEAVPALELLGISAEQLLSVPIEQRMMVLGKAFAMLNKEQRSFAAQKLFDSEGVGLTTLLAELARNGDALFQEFDKLRRVSDQSLEGFESMADSMTNLDTAWTGLKSNLADTGPLRMIVDLLTLGASASSRAIEGVNKFLASFTVGRALPDSGGTSAVNAKNMTEFLTAIRMGNINQPMPDPNLNAMLDELKRQTDLLRQPQPMIFKVEP